MDTCIAIRTMTFKDGVAYLQAGGGIVFDSIEEDEYEETLNKLRGNLMALENAEGLFLPCFVLKAATYILLQNIGVKCNVHDRQITHDIELYLKILYIIIAIAKCM